MAFKRGKLLGKGGSRSPEKLPGDLRKAVEAWRSSMAPELDEWHYHVRYVVVDIATSGPSAEDGTLLGISAVGVREGTVMPADAFTFDLAADADADAVDRQLMAFLAYSAKAPLVTYHSPFVNSFLKPALQNRLGVNFQPSWVDLGWMLPSLYSDRSVGLLPMDDWLERLGIDVIKPMSERYDVAVGIIDVKSYHIKTPEQIADAVHACHKHAPAAKLVFAPDCGLSQTARWAAKKKLASMCAGVEIVKKELGL